MSVRKDAVFLWLGAGGVYNFGTMSKIWLQLIDQMLLGGTQTKFFMVKNNRSKIGMNSLVNKFHVLNNQIELSHFNLKLSFYKNALKNVE